MPRDIKGKVQTLLPKHKEVESREAEGKEGKAKQHIRKDVGSAVAKAGDDENDSNKRKNKEVFDEDDEVQSHHDRLCTIEKHLGLHHWGDDMKSQDQKKMGGPRAESGEHVTEKKGTANYGRKRHS